MSDDQAQPESTTPKYQRFEVRQFGDTQGRRITEFVPLDGQPIVHRGQQTRVVRNARGQQRPLSFSFVIEADTIDQAFDSHDAAAEAGWNEVLGQIGKPKIALARPGAPMSWEVPGNGDGLKMR